MPRRNNRQRQKREKTEKKKREPQSQPQIKRKQLKLNCSKCGGTGMMERDLHLFKKKEKCDQCDIWERRVQALIPS